MGVPINKKKKKNLQALRVRCVGMKRGECPIPHFSFVGRGGKKRKEGGRKKSRKKKIKGLKIGGSLFK